MRKLIYVSYSGFSIKFSGRQAPEASETRISIEVSFAALLSGQVIGQFFDLIRS
jgi:hypothetical protein